jgi:DNA-binding response OmpR family regulator
MAKYHIMVIEDNAEHLARIQEGLEDAGHTVQAVRDLVSLRNADSQKVIKSPDIVILDIMLAEELDLCQTAAPRWEGRGPVPAHMRRRYVDDELGIDIAHAIRKGAFASIPKDVPILFLTARRNKEIVATISSTLSRFAYMDKPAFIEEVLDAIKGLVEKVERTDGRSR